MRTIIICKIVFTYIDNNIIWREKNVRDVLLQELLLLRCTLLVDVLNVNNFFFSKNTLKILYCKYNITFLTFS